MTVCGLATVNLSELTPWQQVILFLQMCIGSPVRSVPTDSASLDLTQAQVVVSWIVVFNRRCALLSLGQIHALTIRQAIHSEELFPYVHRLRESKGVRGASQRKVAQTSMQPRHTVAGTLTGIRRRKVWLQPPRPP